MISSEIIKDLSQQKKSVSELSKKELEEIFKRMNPDDMGFDGIEGVNDEL